MRLCRGIAIFKAQQPEFTQRAVDNLERGLAHADIVQGNMAIFVVLIQQNSVALREGTAFTVFPTEPDRRGFAQQSTECQGFRRAPVDPFAGFDHRAFGF